MKCNACQTDNPAGMKFCVECGSEMLSAQPVTHAPAQASRANKPPVAPGNGAIVYCSSCGTSSASNARFCPACGAAHGSIQRHVSEQISSFVEIEHYDRIDENRSAIWFSRIVAFTVVSLSLRMIIFLTQLPWWVKVGYASWISVGYLLLSFPLQFVLLILIWKTARHTSQTNGQTFVIWIAALLAVLSCVEAFGFYVCNFVGYFDGLVPPSNVLAIICLLFVIRHSFSVPVWTTVLAVLADWFANWLLVRYGAVYLLKLAIVIVFTSPMIFFIIKRPCLRDALRAQR